MKKTKKVLISVFLIFINSLFITSCYNYLMDALSKKIEISFNANGGSPTPSAQRLNREQWVKKPAEPSRSGFTFAGWYEDDNTFNKPWNFRTRVCTALTLYAKWNIAGGGGGNGGSAVCNYCENEPCLCIPITTAVLTVTAPVTWVTPATTASGTGNFTVSSVTWSPAHNLFRSGTQYTVNITLIASTNYTFTGGLTETITINGQAASVTNNGSTAVLSYQFAATAALAPEMVPIPAGNFVRDGHTITLSAFRMSKFQVTQELYEAVMGNNPSHFQGTATDRVVTAGEIQDKRPVETVNWYHAIAFCNRLSILEGLIPAYSITGMSNTDADAWLHSNVPTSNNATWNAVTIVEGSTGYRLPTEAQWEYACRAGSTTTWYFGNDEAQLGYYAWYVENSNNRTRQVGLKLPNVWGLHDMYGNVFEWVWDRWGTFPDPADLSDPRGPSNGDERVLRGGGWNNDVLNTQSASRSYDYPQAHTFNVGFRVVRP